MALLHRGEPGVAHPFPDLGAQAYGGARWRA